MFKNLEADSAGTCGGTKKILLTLAGLLLVAFIMFMVVNEMDFIEVDLGINDDQYQALFLANGEVYFGELETIGDDYLSLEDIYYLRVTPTLQQSTEVDEQGNPLLVENPNEPQINLVKLGEELHGPEDRMVVPMTSVIYWENLSEDGQVATAIAEAQLAAEEAEDQTENAEGSNTETE